MLEPREADIPAFILVLVVLPLVSYILLGRWNEASKKKARISLLAQLAAEEALQVESVTTVSVIVPVINCPSKAGFHMCARCYAPSTTRCSRCKSVRYCSGNCQILHWRQVHKLECQQLDDSNSTLCFDVDSSAESLHQRALLNEISKPALDNIQLDASLHPPISTVTPTTLSDRSADPEAGRKPLDKWVSRNFYEETSRGEAISSFVEESNSVGPISPVHSKEVPTRHKFRKNNSIASSDEIPKKHNISSPLISVRGPPYKIPDQNGSVCETSSGLINCSTSYSERNGINSHDILTHFNSEKASFVRDNDLSSSSEKILGRGIIRSKSPYCILEGKIPVPRRSTKASKEYLYTSSEKEHPVANEPSSFLPVAVQGSNGVSKFADTKMVEPKKLPKLPSDAPGLTSNGLRKNKVLFPYEDFVKFFHCEAWNLSPRGLLNCGNSCYANAVLQCLTSTKPLSIYLLQRSHSRTCRARDWCLMCELEQHVATLKEYGGPLSPSRILSNMRSIGCRMGGGNQEDAHEFLRLLVASMQSICLEGVGSEKEVDPRLQETTFIQHTFGGRLRSKVKCLRCQHESERYDNIMDLTLEILGWVESLEDALTQFTAPEDLDGENMYRCGRCATYVKARKQLSVHEAPNILTIVLKRFQTGKYGKINKCITFPDMLDMIPFMTETGDCPPLYMLYGLVVHLDTLNASFSGHYVSYIKDLQGTWFRIDDTQVEPVSMGQVMSEGAYILFYSRSYPRPLRVYYNGKTIPIQAPVSAKNVKSKAQKTRHSQNTKPMSFSLHSQLGPTTNGASVPRQEIYSPASRNYSDPLSTDYSDATSSDWSLFTSSDESSFTTESTRDSCSTIDYTDTLNGDPVSSLFGTFCMPEYSTSTISCKKSSSYWPQTRFFSESKGFVMESSRSEPQLGSFVHRGKNPEQATDSLTGTGSFVSTAVGNCSTFLRYGSNPKDSSVHKCGCCEL